MSKKTISSFGSFRFEHATSANSPACVLSSWSVASLASGQKENKFLPPSLPPSYCSVDLPDGGGAGKAPTKLYLIGRYRPVFCTSPRNLYDNETSKRGCCRRGSRQMQLVTSKRKQEEQDQPESRRREEKAGRGRCQCSRPAVLPGSTWSRSPTRSCSLICPPASPHRYRAFCLALAMAGLPPPSQQ